MRPLDEALPESKRAHLKNAGYTHYIRFEVWLPLSELWTDSGFPAHISAISAYEDKLKDSEQLGAIRNSQIIEL